MRANRSLVLLSIWSLLVWTTRIRNIVTDPELEGFGVVWRVGLAVSFTGFALVSIGGVVTAARGSSAWLRPVARAFAGWTVAVWIVRAAGIALGGHSAAFVAVHTVLAVVSIVLAVGVWRWATIAGSAGQPTRRLGMTAAGRPSR